MSARHVAVFSFSALGDLIVCLPLLSEIRRIYPQAQLSLVCQRPAVGALARQLEVADRVVEIPTAARRSPLALLRALLILRHLGAEMVFQTFASHGSFGNLMALATNAPIRCGFDDGRLRNALTHRLPLPPKGRHYVEINLDLLRRLGYTDLHVPRDERYLPPLERKSALFANVPPEQSFGQYVVVSVASDPKLSFKRWSAEKWAQLCRKLHDIGIASVFIGAATEKENIENIIQKAQTGHNLAGQTDFADLAALMLQARAVVGTDGMPLHFASALNIPCVGIFGPTSPDFGGPWGTKHRYVSLHLPCSPCYGPHTTGKPISCRTHECLHMMPVELVYRHLCDLIQQSPPPRQELSVSQPHSQ